MSKKKKQIRTAFREAVFTRDNFSCKICGKQDLFLRQEPDKCHFNSEVLDCHHITNRNEMPAGGYVKENGISLCREKCHIMAEEFLQGNRYGHNFSPENLYKLIGSSKELAFETSKRLGE